MMNKTIYFLITFVTINSAYSQSLYLLGGIAQTSPNFSYAESGKSFATNVYSIPKIKPSLTIGYTILEKEYFSIQAMVHYNQLSGSIANTTNIGRAAQSSHRFKTDFNMSQLSLSPIINLKLFKISKYQLSCFLGPKLDYIVSTDQFVDSVNNYIQNQYEDNMKKLVFSSQIGVNIEYQLNKKIGFLAQLSYHYPITEIVNHQEFHIYTYTNPFRQDYMEVSNMRASVRFLQAQVGLSYHLSKTTK